MLKNHYECISCGQMRRLTRLSITDKPCFICLLKEKDKEPCPQS